jgi:hypothetical protein
LVPVVLDEAVGDHNHVNQSPWADEPKACRIEIRLGSAVALCVNINLSQLILS